MKKRPILTYFIIIIPLAFILLAMSGGSPGGRTGSLGDSSNSCTGCHSGTPQAVSGWITTDIPAAGYLLGETYTITLTATDADALRFGFELTAEAENGNKIGQFAITNSTETKLVNNNKAVTHTSQGFTPTGQSKSWSFDWTAPEEAMGVIRFYAAVNAADGNGNSSGDLIYLTNKEISLNTTLVDKVDKKHFAVYPNPSNGSLNISMQDISSNTEINIYNYSGQIIMSLIPEKSVTTIDISDFSKGVYFVKTNTSQSQKVIIY